MNNEHILIHRARSGDRTAFREIVECNKKAVYYLAMHMTGNHHDAEDISQEVFLKMFRSLKGFKGKAKLSSWLYRITVNTCISKMRKKSSNILKFQESSTIDESEVYKNFAEQGQGNPEQYVESDQIGIHIEKALKRITHKERAVFILRHYSDLPLKEIAEVLNVAEGTVKSHLFRAIKKLQKELSFYTKETEMENAK